MCLAAPARVVSVSGQTAVVDYDGVRTNARLETLGEPVAPGDFVLVHAGFAIQRLSPEDAEETLRLFDELAQSLTAEASPARDGAVAGSPPPRAVTDETSPARQGAREGSLRPRSVTDKEAPAQRGAREGSLRPRPVTAEVPRPQNAAREGSLRPRPVTDKEPPAQRGGHGR